MKFILFCEGHTEHKALPAFLKRWLDSRLAQPVGIKSVRFDGWRELVDDSPKKAGIYLAKPDVIAVIALLDLYGPTIYPLHLTTAKDRYNWAKNSLERKVDNSRFKQFFAVHETEAWLLGDKNVFPRQIKSILNRYSRLPESVNFTKPPAKLLNDVYLQATQRRYKKVTHGKELFMKADVNLAYNSCPSLKQMLDEMLFLAAS